MKKYLYAVLFVIGASLNFCFGKQKINFLTKTFFHQGLISDRVVCYFSQDPIFNKFPQKKSKSVLNDKEILTFFLPMTHVDGNESRVMLKKVQESQKNNYSVTFQEVTKPIKGIKINIEYDPKKISYEYQLFDAITGNKGLVLTFHNKDALTQLKNSTDPLLQYAQSSQKKSPKIMLDIGHGGFDEGKVGYFNIQEKNITLQVGMKVAGILKKFGYDVLLTRHGDYFVALDERTTVSNKKKVDLFLSIHANAGPKSSSGIETYWLNSALLKSQQPNGDATVQALTVRRDALSALLAQTVHEATLSAIRKKYTVCDRKVKKSVAQVLLGTDLTIPAALIEIGFLSHEQETRYLIDGAYQMSLAQGIANGITSYLKSIKL